jgi:hypothetical protein
VQVDLLVGHALRRRLLLAQVDSSHIEYLFFGDS